MRSRAYYAVRTAVRAVFWLAVCAFTAWAFWLVLTITAIVQQETWR